MRYKQVTNAPSISDLDLTCYVCKRGNIDFDFIYNLSVETIMKCKKCGTKQIIGGYKLLEYSEWAKQILEDLKNTKQTETRPIDFRCYITGGFDSSMEIPNSITAAADIRDYMYRKLDLTTEDIDMRDVEVTQVLDLSGQNIIFDKV